MTTISEVDAVSQTFPALERPVTNMCVAAESRNDTNRFLETSFTDFCTDYGAENSLSRSSSVRPSVVTNSTEDALPTVDSGSSSNQLCESSLMHTDGVEISQSNPDICDTEINDSNGALSIGRHSLEYENRNAFQSGENSNLDDEADPNDVETNHWLQGTLQHLQRAVSRDENNTIVDENEMDISNMSVLEEETVEVQEFLQEEEIQDESTQDNSDDGSSKEDETPLSYDLQQGYKILREIMGSNNKSITWPFVNAVDRNAQGCHNYYEKIKNPMWLMKMKEKFERREYENITQYVSDMRLMLENCYRFNGLHHPISRHGEKLELLMEQKLLLLSRELREKTSLAATSGKVVDIPITGTRRQKFSGASGTTTLLHRLRWESLEKEKEAKRLQQLEKKMQYEEFLKGLQTWEDRLFEEPLRQEMKAMWELPQIGQFLFLCEKALNLGEISQYELECCLLLPRESSALQRIMTSILSTPHQRARIQGKTLMPYRVWNERLSQLLSQWFKIYQDNDRNRRLTVMKLGIDEKFFKVVGNSNPLERKKFHELTFYQRVWILKSLCDNCMETQKSLIEVIESQPLLDLRESILGKDNDGNIYIHFPQFCGEDLRIYRQSPQPIVIEETKKEKVSYPKARLKKRRKHKDRSLQKKTLEEPPDASATSPTPRIRDSRLRQNPKQVQSYKVTESSTSSDSEGSSDEDDEEEEEDQGAEAAGEEEEPEEEEEKKENIADESRNNVESETPVKNKEEKEGAVVEENEYPEEKEEPQPKVLRSSRRRTTASRNSRENVEDSSALEPNQDAWNAFDGSSAVIPRRSLRKIIEESKKDAAPSPAASSTGRSRLRRSSISSSSSAALSRTGTESVSSQVQSSGKRSSLSSTRKDKRKRESSSEEGEDNAEKTAFLQTTPRVTRSKIQGQKVGQATQRSAEKKKRRSDTVAAHTETPEPIEFGRITRNLYKSLLELKVDVPVHRCQDGKGNENSGKKGKKENGRKKRSCLTTTSDRDAEPGDCKNGEAPGDGIVKMETDSQNVSFNGHIAESYSCDNGQGDSAVKSDPDGCSELNDKMEIDEKLIVSVKDKEGECEVDEKPLVSSVEIKEEAAAEKAGQTIDSEKSTVAGESVTMVEKVKEVAVLGETADENKLLKCQGDVEGVCDSELNSDTLKTGETKQQEASPVGELKLGEVEQREALPEGESKQVEGMDLVQSDAKQTDSGLNNANIEADAVDKAVENPEAGSNLNEEVCEILGPEIGPFELIVSSIEGLRELVDKFADKEENELEEPSSPQEEEKEMADDKSTYRKRCTIELHKRLSCLLQEVATYEPRLLKLNKKKMIRLRKEQENYKEEPGKEQGEDIWENNDSASCTSNGNTEATTNDESSIDAESSSSKVEEKPTEVLKRPRPSRKKPPAAEAVPSVPASEMASETPTANNNSGINTRKRAAQSQGKAPNAKRAKVLSNSTEETRANTGSSSRRKETIVETPTSSSSAGVYQKIQDSVLHGLETAAKKKLRNEPQASSLGVSSINSRNSNTPLGKDGIFQQSNFGPQKLSSASSNLITRLFVSNSGVTSNVTVGANSRLVAGTSLQPASLGNQNSQSNAQPNVVRFASPLGSDVRLLGLNNINQLPQSILQQLFNGQNLVVVSPPSGPTATTASPVLPSNLIQNCLLVSNSGVPTTSGTNQMIKSQTGSNVTRQVCSRNVPYTVPSRPAAQDRTVLPHPFQQPTGTVLSSGTGYLLPSQMKSSQAMTLSARLNSPMVRPMQSLPVPELPSLRLVHATSNALTGDTTVRPKYTNNLTVRALLSNRATTDQFDNLAGSMSSSSEVLVSSASSIGGLMAVSSANCGVSSMQSQTAGHISVNALTCRLIDHSSVVISSSGVNLRGGEVSSNGGKVLPLPGNPSPALQAVQAYVSRNASVSLASKLAASTLPVTKPLQVHQSMPLMQRLMYPSAAAKPVVSTVSNIRMPQIATAIVSGNDNSKQIVLVSPEQAAAIARKHIVDQAVKAAITAPISTSLPTVNLEVPVPSGMPQTPRNVNTQTTTVMKSPIPALPQLFNHGLSPSKVAIHSSSTSATGVSAVISPNNLQTMMTSPQASSSIVQVKMPASLSGAVSVPGETRMPILLNSAIVMPGTQNLLLLQQTPMQILPLASGQVAVNQSPVKSAVGMSASLCNVASVGHAKPLQKPVQTSSLANLLVQVDNSIQQLTMPVQSISTSHPVAQSALHLSASQPAARHVPPSGVAPQFVPQSPNKNLLPTVVASNVPATGQWAQAVATPNNATAVAPKSAVENARSLASPARQAYRLVVPPKYDGIPLGQLMLQGGVRLMNRLPSGVAAVPQNTVRLTDAGGVNAKTSEKQLNNIVPQNVHVINASLSAPRPGVATMAAAQGEKLLGASQASVGVVSQTGHATTTPPGQSKSMSVQMNMGLGRFVNTASTMTPLNPPTIQLVSSPRQTVYQMQTNAANVNNIKGPVVQLAVQPRMANLQPARGQVMQLTVQPVDANQGKTAAALPSANESIGFNRQMTEQPILQVLSPSGVASTNTNTLPAIRQILQFSSSSVSQKPSPVTNSASAQLVHASNPSRTPLSLTHAAVQQNSRMNLEVAASWLLQAASVVESSSVQECNSNNPNQEPASEV